jgi:hypothetical protein
VVDYLGIGNELKAAMKEYTASKGRGKPTVDARSIGRDAGEAGRAQGFAAWL